MSKRKVTFNVKAATCGYGQHNSFVFDDEDVDTNVHEAEAYCTTCQKFMCVQCIRLHRRHVVMDNHKVVNRDHELANDANSHKDISLEYKIDTAKLQEEFDAIVSNSLKEYTACRTKLIEGISNRGDISDEHIIQEEIRNFNYNFLESCTHHKEKMIKYYCMLHQQLCCDMCIHLNHKACSTEVKYIPEEAHVLENLSASFTKFDAQIEKFKEYDRHLQSDFKELKKSRETFLYDLNVKKREFLDWLNLMEVRAIRRVESIYDKCKQDIEKKRKQTKDVCENLRAEVYLLKQIICNNANDNVYKYIKIKQAEQNLHENVLKKEHRAFTNTRFGLKINDGIAIDMDKTEQLFELKFEHKGETKFNIRLKNDKHVSNITGCTITPSGAMAFADRNNAKIKVYNSRIKLIANVNIPDGVFDITYVGQNAVAVTSPMKSKIHIIEIRPELETTKTINTGTGSCWGVKHHEGIFVVNISTTVSSFVRAIDQESKIIFQLETKCSYFSEIFTREGSKAVNIITVTPFVQCNNANRVHFIEERTPQETNDFKLLEYNYLNHLHTRGVTLDKHYNLVVCCKDTDQIYAVSNPGDDAQLLLAESDGLKAPQALCYNVKKTKLLVTSENSDFIQIFEFVD